MSREGRAEAGDDPPAKAPQMPQVPPAPRPQEQLQHTMDVQDAENQDARDPSSDDEDMLNAALSGLSAGVDAVLDDLWRSISPDPGSATGGSGAITTDGRFTGPVELEDDYDRRLAQYGKLAGDKDISNAAIVFKRLKRSDEVRRQRRLRKEGRTEELLSEAEVEARIADASTFEQFVAWKYPENTSRDPRTGALVLDHRFDYVHSRWRGLFESVGADEAFSFQEVPLQHGTHCTTCGVAFGFFTLSYNCGKCGLSFCDEHSRRTMQMVSTSTTSLKLLGFGRDDGGSSSPTRVCDACYAEMRSIARSTPIVVDGATAQRLSSAGRASISRPSQQPAQPTAAPGVLPPSPLNPARLRQQQQRNNSSHRSSPPPPPPPSALEPPLWAGAVLAVEIKAATAIRDMQLIGAMDPYVSCWLLPSRTLRRTRAASGGGVEPRWTSCRTGPGAGAGAQNGTSEVDQDQLHHVLRYTLPTAADLLEMDTARQKQAEGDECEADVHGRRDTSVLVGWDGEGLSLSIELWNENVATDDDFIASCSVDLGGADGLLPFRDDDDDDDDEDEGGTNIDNSVEADGAHSEKQRYTPADNELGFGRKGARRRWFVLDTGGKLLCKMWLEKLPTAPANPSSLLPRLLPPVAAGEPSATVIVDVYRAAAICDVQTVGVMDPYAVLRVTPCQLRHDYAGEGDCSDKAKHGNNADGESATIPALPCSARSAEARAAMQLRLAAAATARRNVEESDHGADSALVKRTHTVIEGGCSPRWGTESGRRMVFNVPAAATLRTRYLFELALWNDNAVIDDCIGSGIAILPPLHTAVTSNTALNGAWDFQVPLTTGGCVMCRAQIAGTSVADTPMSTSPATLAGTEAAPAMSPSAAASSKPCARSPAVQRAAANAASRRRREQDARTANANGGSLQPTLARDLASPQDAIDDGDAATPDATTPGASVLRVTVVEACGLRGMLEANDAANTDQGVEQGTPAETGGVQLHVRGRLLSVSSAAGEDVCAGSDDASDQYDDADRCWQISGNSSAGTITAPRWQPPHEAEEASSSSRNRLAFAVAGAELSKVADADAHDTAEGVLLLELWATSHSLFGTTDERLVGSAVVPVGTLRSLCCGVPAPGVAEAWLPLSQGGALMCYFAFTSPVAHESARDDNENSAPRRKSFLDHVDASLNDLGNGIRTSLPALSIDLAALTPTAIPMPGIGDITPSLAAGVFKSDEERQCARREARAAAAAKSKAAHDAELEREKEAASARVDDIEGADALEAYLKKQLSSVACTKGARSHLSMELANVRKRRDELREQQRKADAMRSKRTLRRRTAAQAAEQWLQRKNDDTGTAHAHGARRHTALAAPSSAHTVTSGGIQPALGANGSTKRGGRRHTNAHRSRPSPACEDSHEDEDGVFEAASRGVERLSELSAAAASAALERFNEGLSDVGIGLHFGDSHPTEYLVVFGEQQNRRRISRGAAPLRHEVRVRAEPHRDAPEVGRLFAGEVVRAVSAPRPVQNAEGYIEEWVLVHVPESAGADGAGSDDAETEPLQGWTALTWRELRGGKSEGQDKPCSVHVHEMLRPHST